MLSASQPLLCLVANVVLLIWVHPGESTQSFGYSPHSAALHASIKHEPLQKWAVC